MNNGKPERKYKFIPVDGIFSDEVFGILIAVEAPDCQCKGCVYAKRSRYCINRAYACTSGRREDGKSVILDRKSVV